MPDTIGSAWVEINSNIAQLQREIAGLKGHVDASARNMETRFNTATKAIAGLGSVIATIGVAKFGNDIFQASLKMENLNKMLLANEGSQKKANDAMAKYLIMAKSPGLNLTQIAQSMTQLKSLEVSATQAERTIMALGNQMVLSGHGAEGFGRVMIQIEQSIGKGRLMAEDLRVVAESMPMVRKLMRDAFGEVDTEKLAKMGITAIDFWTKLTEQMEKSPKAIDGTQNSIDNFKDSLLQFQAAIGDNVLPQVGKFLDKLTNMMDSFNKLPDPIKNVIGTATLGGLGLLGIGSALAFIVSNGANAVKVLKELAGVNIATSAAGALVGTGANIASSGLVNQFGRSIASTGAGAVKSISTLSIVSATIGKLLLPVGAFAAIWELTKWSQKGFENLPAPGVSPGGTSTMALPRMGITPKKTGSIMSDEDYKLLQKEMEWKPRLAEFGKAKAVSPLAISYADMIKEIGEASVDFLMNPYGYSTEAGKYKSVFTQKTTSLNRKLSSAGWWAGQQNIESAIPSAARTGPQIGRANLFGYGGPGMAGGLPRENMGLLGAGLGISEDIEHARLGEELYTKELLKTGSAMEAVKDDWDDLADSLITKTEEADKEQSQFWYDMKSYATFALDMTISKSIDDFYNHFGWVMSDTENSWKAFCNNLSAEFLKMLIKMETEAEAKNVFNLVSGKGYGGGGGIGGTIAGMSKGESSSGVLDKAAGYLPLVGAGLQVYSMESERQDYLKNTPMDQRQYDTKQYIESLFHMGKYEDAIRGVHADPKGYETYMAKTGIEPYPLAKGGIITRPTIALMGEAGPEAVVPLSKGNMRSDNFVVNISFPNATLDSVDQNQIDRFISKAIPSLRRAVSNGELS